MLILNGSPKKNGNTAVLIDWFVEGVRSKCTEVQIVHTAALAYKTNGCLSCRECQKLKEYNCVIRDDVRSVLSTMLQVNVIVMATPLYFFSASAQLKMIIDRMFSLYKWDNDAGTFETPLKDKTLVLLASACERNGIDILEKQFALIAEYAGMRFESLLAPYAGISGEIKNSSGIREKTISFGKGIVSEKRKGDSPPL